MNKRNKVLSVLIVLIVILTFIIGYIYGKTGDETFLLVIGLTAVIILLFSRGMKE